MSAIVIESQLSLSTRRIPHWEIHGVKTRERRGSVALLRYNFLRHCCHRNIPNSTFDEHWYFPGIQPISSSASVNSEFSLRHSSRAAYVANLISWVGLEIPRSLQYDSSNLNRSYISRRAKGFSRVVVPSVDDFWIWMAQLCLTWNWNYLTLTNLNSVFHDEDERSRRPTIVGNKNNRTWTIENSEIVVCISTNKIKRMERKYFWKIRKSKKSRTCEICEDMSKAEKFTVTRGRGNQFLSRFSLNFHLMSEINRKM